MSDQNRVYSFENVQVIVNGTQLTGFTEGDDVVQVEDNSDVTMTSIGADGKALTSVSTDRSALYTIKLQPTSDGHKYMTSLYNAYKQGNPIKFPVYISDFGTGESDSSNECVIQKAPNRQKGAEASDREWVIFAPCNISGEVNYSGP